MSTRDLLKHPLWTAETLGRPLPDSIHAVSMALPRWQDVVGYEEHRPEVLARLTSGYPRFVVHPLVKKLAATFDAGTHCLPFPSTRTATQCAEFVRRRTGEPARVCTRDGLSAAATTEGGSAALMAFWQHTGVIVSSRQAEAHLQRRAQPEDQAERRTSLRRQLADWYDCEPNDVFLSPTGMAAQYAALQAVSQRRPGLPTAQLGFPYVDTLKLQEKLGHGSHLLHQLNEIEKELQSLCQRQPLAACFCELPGNPLLGSADVRRITPILRREHIPLVVDDVVATPFNVDLRPHADLIATSLTKYIAGTGDVMGGALICNPSSPLHGQLKAIVQSQHEELLWSEDVAILDTQARTFPERMKRHNQNGLWLAERLRQHPAVERVWYPKWEFSEVYDGVRRPEGGWGALVTILPKNAETKSALIYDALAFCKGPSLGTVFTLACPFTLLAHYSELEWAESCGVSRYLIRISVGLEAPEDLWRRLETALTA